MSSAARTNSLLFVLFLVLLAVIALQWLNPPLARTVILTNADAAAQTANTIVGEPLTPLSMAPLGQYQEVIERPLFFQSRRPPPPEAAVPEPVPEPVAVEESEFTLIGVMVVGDSKIVMLQNAATRKVSSLRIGDKIENWQVEQIYPNSVIIRRGEAAKELALVRNQRKPSAKISKQVQQLKEQRRQLALERLRAQQRLQQGEEAVNDETLDENGEIEQPEQSEDEPPVDEQGELTEEQVQDQNQQAEQQTGQATGTAGKQDAATQDRGQRRSNNQTSQEQPAK